jgi:sulfite reductase (NADPH) flavoprotein alpha-component
MAIAKTQSGEATPLSPTSTLSVPTSPHLKPLQNFPTGRLLSASNHVEYLASRAARSSAVFVYDLAEQAGFGTLTKAWDLHQQTKKSEGKKTSQRSASDTAPVTQLQTRAGAGLTLLGRLSYDSSSSSDLQRRNVVTAYTTPTGLKAMAGSLASLPPATATSKLVVHVPTVSPIGEDFTLSPTLAALGSVLPLLPESSAVLLSATPKETVDIALLSYIIKDTHVVHLFDHWSSAREVGHTLEPYPESLSSTTPSQESLTQVLQSAGYKFFDYYGDPNAETVLVVLNGPLGLTLASLIGNTSDLGVIAVRVLRPWDEDSFSNALPKTARNVHVLEDVPFETALGVLHTDVLGSLVSSADGGDRPLPVVRSERIVPARLKTLLDNLSALETFISGIVPQFTPQVPPTSPSTKIIQFYSTPGTPLSSVPQLIEQTFAPTPKSSISSRLLTNYDLVTRSSGIALDWIVLSKAGSPTLSSCDRPTDFVAVLDQALLKTHIVLETAKPGAIALIITSWTAQELIANLPAETLSLIRKRKLQICVLDVRKLVPDIHIPVAGALEPVLVYIAFLRLYLGAATKADIARLTRANPIAREVENLRNIEVKSLVDGVWDGLVRVTVPAKGSGVHTTPMLWSNWKYIDRDQPPPKVTPPALKRFGFNAIATEVEGGTVVNGAKLSSWHDAAKHILFPSIFFAPSELSSSSSGAYSQNPHLRPEVPDRTFLVTCTVNKRLTPLEYDRNVFHLEFDTSGTGLKYEIGEALGVHGWNDTQEVLDFCEWYGINPDGLVTLPVPSSTEGHTRYHTRTIFQALQQQIDIFGKPPKSFYSDLAPFATHEIDRLALLFIGSAEGSSTFKKMSEIDTANFADVLKQFKSARPGVEVLCEMVGDIKPRHYSIASAQAVVGDRVDLLVVTVEWETPSGLFLSFYRHWPHILILTHE